MSLDPEAEAREGGEAELGLDQPTDAGKGKASGFIDPTFGL